ncbi:hypothetical protein F5Y04DRAFT_190922 [Hypomontagnella monticulosa]|nr:hypothetical protein F5Y04DRAFT_190922 [Hypomontagnella monticulosa]
MEDDSFLPAPELGLKPIHIACLEGDLEAVIKLACEPSNIDVCTEPTGNNVGHYYETPIELAALMGHLEVVEFLVQQGASLAHDGYHASSYAGGGGLAGRRRGYFLGTVKLGRQPRDAVNARKAVYDLLTSPGRRSVLKAMTGPRADLGFPDYKLAKQGRYIVVYTPVLRVKTDITLDRSKTIGVITAKGDGDVLMAAHSGFRLGGDRDEAKCLDTNAWNYIALHHLAARLNFQFPGNRHDNGAKAAEDEHRGRAHAGHVEVLLGAWYALEMTKKTTGKPDASLEWLLAQMHTLKKQTLGLARSAIIMIDSQPCATCLKFINRLFQYTGLHFSVKGAVGVGPTLATKDPRFNIRCDTFGDVFEESEGEEGGEDNSDGEDEDRDAEGESVVMETPSPVHNAEEGGRDVAGEATVSGEDSVVIGQTIRDSLREIAMARSRSSPVTVIDEDDDDDTDGDIIPPAVGAAPPDQATPVTPARQRMQWPIPENRPRRTPVAEDPFQYSPSRRPANPAELLAEYKKKTPVWNWPGYENMCLTQEQAQYEYEQQQRQAQLQQHYQHAALLSPAPMMRKASLNSAMAEDPILVDLTDDNSNDVDSDSAPYTPDIGSSELTLCRSTTSGDSHATVFNLERDGRVNPVPLSRGEFSYSSFAPIPGNSQEQQPVMTPVSQRDMDADSSPDVIMQSSSDEGCGDAEGYYYVPRLQPSQLSQVSEHSHSFHSSHSHATADNGSSFTEEYEEEPRVPTPHPAVPGAVRLQQWRYQPPARPQRGVAQRCWVVDGQVRDSGRFQRFVVEIPQRARSPGVEGGLRGRRG